jgi:hypothetical protein
MSFLGKCNLLVHFWRFSQWRTKYKQEMRLNRAFGCDVGLRTRVAADGV